jgi:hypothetical protein
MKKDYTIPNVAFLEDSRQDGWNEIVLENIVKSINTPLIKIYENLLQT